ncbi:MAG: DUF4254 domain-containing protein [Bacteroidota bacterium]|nr:DUF4254 domain-containing protein [Bacteroidota bacterium]MDP4205497.1 DUF4254 domain-containing protein [Bacteroidota bacterium]
MSFSKLCNKIFNECVYYYHTMDDVDAQLINPYPTNTIENFLFKKNWIDAVQWHLEDIIRDPKIDPVLALKIKRRIDASNQERTDLVEAIDDYFFERYKDKETLPHAMYNTESPAWAIDRLSILALKIYHMHQELGRKDASDEHIQRCSNKLNILLQQRIDLSASIDQLLKDIETGNKFMKVYKQMKMYNDPQLNPVLYKSCTC